jgi:hypothetical protein
VHAFDLSIALRLRHDLSKVATPTPRSGACDGYPWVPTDQAHGRPDKWVWPTRRPTDMLVGPTRPPEDLPEDSPNDLIQHDLKTWRIRKDIDGFRPKQIGRIWQAM